MRQVPNAPASSLAAVAIALLLPTLSSAPAFAQVEGEDAPGEAAPAAPAAADPAPEESPAPEAAPAGPAAAAADDSDLEDESTADASATDEGIGLTLQDRIKAVSRKVFIKAGRVEFNPLVGVSTNDAFFRHYTTGGRLTYHIFDSFSIDGGGAVNLYSQYLDPIRTVKQQLNAIPNVAILYGYTDIGVTFAPIYGKFALMSEWIIHFDTFVSGGVGITVDSNQYTFFGTQLPDYVPGVNPAAEVGIGGRVFITKWMVFRADLRDYVYPQYRNNVSTFQNLLMLNVGLGFYFPFDFEYEYTAAKVVEG